MFEIFEHSADLGLRVRAATLDALFAEAGQGLASLLVANPEAIDPKKTVIIDLHARNTEDLFFDWLADLLRRSKSRNLLFRQFIVSVNGTSLHAEASGEEIDPRRHRVAHAIKAITYHALSVRQTPEGWVGQVIVDI